MIINKQIEIMFLCLNFYQYIHSPFKKTSLNLWNTCIIILNTFQGSKLMNNDSSFTKISLNLPMKQWLVKYSYYFHIKYFTPVSTDVNLTLTYFLSCNYLTCLSCHYFGLFSFSFTNSGQLCSGGFNDHYSSTN